MARRTIAFALLLAPAAAFAPSARHATTTRLQAFKEPSAEQEAARYAEAPRRPKSKVRPRDPSLYMEPVPLVPDAEGNWEPLVGEIWTDIEKMSKLAEVNFKADLTRFREFCDRYRAARGTISANGRAVSAQTRLFDPEQPASPVRDVKDHKWVKKLAKRLAPICLDEYEAALNPTHTRNGTWATRTRLVWSREQIMARRAEPWDQPAAAAEDEGEAAAPADPKAGMDEAAKDAAAAAEEMTGGGASEAAPAPAPAEELAPPAPAVEEEPSEPAWRQLMLQQVTPLKTGVLRFPRVLKALGKYEATSPPPRHVVVATLPPGCATEPRADLQDFLLTVQIPLRGCEGAGLVVGGEKVPFEAGAPVVFDSTYDYHVYNDGAEELLLMHVDFWHPDVTVDEKQMLAYFWMLWQFDQYHPSTRAKYTRRVNYRKEQERKEKEERRKAIKKSNDKKDGGGGGSIARK
mmetsp:Transcript_12540/g.37657  ORF Transcript_12540/g.37657 Transcript_12540/m.37657 type:complete len:462 (+) Transcript_12540:80-1465(+)